MIERLRQGSVEELVSGMVDAEALTAVGSVGAFRPEAAGRRRVINSQTFWKWSIRSG